MTNPNRIWNLAQGLMLVLLMTTCSFAQAPREEKRLFNGNDLTGWQGESEFWSVKDGVIIGHSDEELPNNKFLWSNVEVGDFYLSVDVRMPKDNRNAGIQFRSKRTSTPNMQAIGYQADAGKGVWGRLYHEHGRGKLDWTDRGETAVKPGKWNRYEILAVGHHVWTAINGQLSVAVHDPNGELRGHLALQIHSGQPQTVEYKINRLIHNPEIALAGKSEQELLGEAKFVFDGKPNLIVIFTDDQGYGDLSCFGSKTIKTPNIDRMAKEGRKFTNFMVPTALCTPSRAGLLTGCYPKRVGMHNWVLLPESKEGLHPDEYTIADHLKTQDYATACIGKWHLGHHPETLPINYGFDTYFGIPYPNDMNHPDNQGKPNLSLKGLDDLWIDQESTLTKWKTPLMQDDQIIELPVDQRTITRRYTDKSIEFNKENQDAPFFLYLAHTMPHLPLYVPEDFHDPDPKQAYVRTIEHIDAEVGRLMDAIRELGIDQNTYVIFASDNGPASGNQHHAGTTGGLRGHKTSTFEGGCRVPCIVWGPNRVPAGTQCDQLFSTLDILPTIAAMTGTKLPADRKIDGLDASALLVDENAKTPRDEMLYYDGHGVLEGIRNGNRKLLVKKNRTMLFDLEDDLGEQNNLAEANPQEVQQLAARMKTLGDEVERNARPAWVKGRASTATPRKPRVDQTFFNGNDLTGWNGAAGFWSVKDGSIVGHSDANIPSNQFLWSDVEVGDFYLSVDVRLQPNTANAGIQFRSQRVSKDDPGAVGYQADAGQGCWGRIWHENGRGVIDWTDRGEKAIQPGEWNRYEVLAVGHRIWTAINGTLAVAKEDPEGELRGHIAVQMNAGPPQRVEYRIGKLIHDPKVALAGLTEQQLIDATKGFPTAANALDFNDDGTQAMTPEAVKRFADQHGDGAAKGPFGEAGFQLEANDTVVFVGGANMVRSRHDGTLEGLLSLKFAEQKPRFRNMAWEGDTIYEQWRDLDFGSWTDQLAGVGATVLIVDFGQMEAIEGVARLDEFIAAYETLLDEFQQTTQRIVLLTPRPFEKPRSPHMVDHSGENSDVKQYVEAIQQIARERQLICVDLFTPLEGSTENLTTNGIHLDAASHSKVAMMIADGLVAEVVKTFGSAPKPKLLTSSATKDRALLTAIREKNRLWHDNWRPMNWSFAFGDRTNQPFGKSIQDHPPLKSELAAFKPLIRNAEKQIHDIALAISSGKSIPEFQSVAATLTYPKQQVDPAEHTPEAELKTFTPADGYEVNLFADESYGVVKPVQMRWDDSGRLWVACIPTYPHIEPGAKPGDYIIVCEDTDGDGRADKFTRFAEGLFIAMGIEFGDGGVYVSENTDIVFLKDTDGDGKADSREMVLSGFGTADSHQMVNNIHRGPCGDFWFTQGHHAYSRVETPYGISKLSKAGVWRYRPKTGQLDGFFDGSKAGLNCQGITHDDWGQTFHNSAAASGGFYTSAGAIDASPNDEIGPLVNPPERNTGIEFVGTKHLPDDLQGNIVWSGFMNNNLQRRRLIDDGSGFQGEKMPNLLQSSSRSFRPVNAKVGPDGGIYICDWYNPTIGHYQASYRDPQRDRTRGRIWRLTAKDRPLSKTPALKDMTPEELLDHLRSEERLTRINAKKRLFDMPTETAIAATDAWVAGLEKNADHERLLMIAAGIYAAHEVVNVELLERLLAAVDGRVRAFGTRLIGRWHAQPVRWPSEAVESSATTALERHRTSRQPSAGLMLEDSLTLLRRCVQDEHPRVRLEAIVACSYIPSAKAMEVAAMAADQARDHYLDYAMKLCVKKLKPHWAPALARGEFDFGTSPQRLRFVLEMDGTKDSAKFIRRLLGDLAERREPSGVEQLEGSRPSTKTDPGNHEEAREGLFALLAGLGTPADLQYVVQNSSLSPAVLRELVTVAEVHKRRPQGDLVAPVREWLSVENTETRSLAVRLAGLWNLQALREDVRSILTQTSVATSVTEAALVTLGRLDASAAKKAAMQFADSNQPPSIQVAAIESIVNSDLSLASRLAASLLANSESERLTSEIVALFLSRNNGTDSLHRVFAELADQGQPLAADAATLIHRTLSASGRTDGQLMAMLNNTLGNHTAGNSGAQPTEYSAEYVKQLADEVRSSGNAANGLKVYQSKLANCAACHKLHGSGGEQGPDLSLIGAGRSEEQLAESVLWPNRQIREGFMATKILTVDGLILTGLPVKETDEELHLRDATTGKIRRIAIDDIEAESEAGSIMPAGLTAGMTREDVRDLVRFLSELRGAKQE